ncbi:AarF/UbiB family protein [Luteimonas sp. 100069]|uniref:ABC1 kinase family protein n=1 Tax=Luteimonas sp. 100069 TaxID=2006109 RepID=UPI000F4E3649|nr:AarF/UbiB family protein [Luteimonas sp. 100069]RPD85895.1 AarF/ABC1/UbiB kinase family protein [Luteimonas sp. 100069]
MSDTTRALARHAQILRFLMKYRSAGVLSGFELDPVGTETPVDSPDGKPEAFVDDLEALGPTFIKIGQALSTRPDMVPPAYLAALERMQDNVAPLPFHVIHDAVEEALGVRISKIFDSFDETPLGSASLAQVHRATLRDGRKVAVKVQRPGIAEQIRDDLETLARLAGGVDRITDIGRRVHFADWVHEFRRTLLAELDYRIEAENLDRFDAHFVAYPALFVPRPLWDLTRARVLTMELVEGTKVTDISGLQRTERDMAPLATALLHGYLDQVFVHGEIHADPHPGNLLLTRDGRLALFDLGMVAHVPPRTRERLLRLLFAAVDGRGEQVAAEGIAMGTRLEDFDEARYYRDVGQLVARYAAQSGANGQTEGRLMLDLVRLATACGLRTAPEMSLLGKTLLHLESVVQALDPELDMKRVVEAHLNDMMRQRLRKSLSPTNLASELMDMQELVRDAPRKLSNVLSLLSENRLRVRLTGLEESHLFDSMHKIANRIAAGIVTAALIVASAMMMDNPDGPRLLGYPTIALLLFLTGAGLGIAIVLSALLGDKRPRPDEERGPN